MGVRLVIRANCSRSTADKYFWTRNLLSSSKTCALVNSTRLLVFVFVEVLLVVSFPRADNEPLPERNIQILM